MTGPPLPEPLDPETTDPDERPVWDDDFDPYEWWTQDGVLGRRRDRRGEPLAPDPHHRSGWRCAVTAPADCCDSCPACGCCLCPPCAGEMDCKQGTESCRCESETAGSEL